MQLYYLIILLATVESRFQDTHSKWISEKNTIICNEEEEFCSATASGDGCQYEIKPIGERKFGAKVTGVLSLGDLSPECADQLIQDAIMFRFLLFPGQTSMTWQDQIKFTESMGEGNAFPETTSAKRQVNLNLKVMKKKVIVFFLVVSSQSS